jgi:hypothetical protein
MIDALIPLSLLMVSSLSPQSSGPAVVVAERASTGFRFEGVPPPAVDDCAASAKLEIVDGRRDENGAGLAALVDGVLPANADEPRANFFFRSGDDGGRLLFDLGRAVEVAAVATYSWHVGDRAPQVYTLFAADGAADGFVRTPARPLDPERSGWTRVAVVDTRSAEEGAGRQHGVLIRGADGTPLGTYRFLLLEVHRTRDRAGSGETFFSEIDVVDAGGPEPERAAVPEPIVREFASEDGRWRFTVDLTRAPDLEAWVADELVPAVIVWYPKLVAMLPSEGFRAPAHVHLEFKDDMGGVPAYAAGARLSLSIPFFRAQLEREAKGCVIHELVHVVQSYRRVRRGAGPRPEPVPGWVVEGIADYVRWFLFEPEAKGAEITARNLRTARYDGSYRISANFIDWVLRHHDRDLLEKLNAAAREGRYEEELWSRWTGRSLQELGELWLEEHRGRLGGGRR